MGKREKEVVYDRNDRPLERVFRNPTSRILDFFLTNQRNDFSTSEISRIGEIPLRTVQKVVPHLLKVGLIVKARRIGNAQTYAPNPQSFMVHALTDIVTNTAIEKEIENK